METNLGTESSQRSADTSGSSETSIGGASATIVATVSELVDVMSRGGITELDLDYLDVRIRLRGAVSAAAVSAAPVVAAPVALPSNSMVPDPVTVPPVAGIFVTAPMVGTFYASPTPGDPPFVQAGDTVSVGQTIGIIEAMKIMNEIAAEVDGIVAEVLVSNGQPVEYGTELLRLSPAAGSL